MDRGPLAGFYLVSPLPSEHDGVEYWATRHPDGRTGEATLGPPSLVDAVRTLPQGGPWGQTWWGEDKVGPWVLMPGEFAVSLTQLRGKLDAPAAFAVGLLLMEALAPVHEAGGAHKRLHPSCMGFDRRGVLRVRPRLGGEVVQDITEGADPRATDCWAVGCVITWLLGSEIPATEHTLDEIRFDGVDERRARLTLSGLLRTNHRFRLFPASHGRQALMALLHSSEHGEDHLTRALEKEGLGTGLRDNEKPIEIGGAPAPQELPPSSDTPTSPLPPLTPPAPKPRTLGNTRSNPIRRPFQINLKSKTDDAEQSRPAPKDLQTAGPAPIRIQLDPTGRPVASILTPEEAESFDAALKTRETPAPFTIQVPLSPDPVPEIEAPEIEIEEPVLEIEAPEIEIEEPVLEIEEPEIDPVIEEPEIEIEEPVLEIEEPEIEPEIEEPEIEPEIEEPEIEPEIEKPEIEPEPEPKEGEAEIEPKEGEPEPEPLVSLEEILAPEEPLPTPSWPEAPADPPPPWPEAAPSKPAWPEVPDDAPSLLSLEPLGTRREITAELEEAQAKPPAEAQPEPQAAPEPQPDPPAPEDFGLSMGPRDVGMLPEGLGVGSLEDREDALGPGKWLEQGRSAAEITRDLPSTPIREIEIETGGYPWARFAVMGLILAGGVAAFRAVWPPGDDPSEEPRSPIVADAATVQPLHTTHAAASDAPTVTITSNLEGARVTLDGQDHGRVPATVPVPMDQVLHEICVQKGARIRCLNLAGEDLAARDPYRVEVEALPGLP